MLSRLLGCLLNLGMVLGYSTGAGNCDNAIPAAMQPTFPGATQTAWQLIGPTAPVVVGEQATLTLSAGGGAGIAYTGISLYCEDAASGSKVGSFVIPSSLYRVNANCGAGNLGLTHLDKTEKTLESFTWNAPSTPGRVVCKGIALANREWQANLAASFDGFVLIS